MPGLRDRPEFAWGEDGENAIARKLQRDGCIVHAVSQYKNHDRAPVLYSIEQANDQVRTVLADLIVWGRGKPPVFGEVKRKNGWVLYYDKDWPDRGLETGFDEHLWADYLKAQQDTGTTMLVFWIQENEPPTGVYVSTIDALAGCNANGQAYMRPWDGCTPAGKPVSKPLSLFPLKVLKRFCDLSELELEYKPAQREIEIPHERVELSTVSLGGESATQGLRRPLLKGGPVKAGERQTDFLDLLDKPKRGTGGSGRG